MLFFCPTFPQNSETFVDFLFVKLRDNLYVCRKARS